MLRGELDIGTIIELPQGLIASTQAAAMPSQGGTKRQGDTLAFGGGRYRINQIQHWGAVPPARRLSLEHDGLGHPGLRSQEAIGAELEVPQRTVSDVIAALSGKRDAAKTAKPKLRSPRPLASV